MNNPVRLLDPNGMSPDTAGSEKHPIPMKEVVVTATKPPVYFAAVNLVAMGGTWDPEPFTKATLLAAVVGYNVYFAYELHQWYNQQENVENSESQEDAESQSPTNKKIIDHAKKRMGERKVFEQSVHEAINKGVARPGNKGDRIVYELPAASSSTGRGVRVVVEGKTGEVVTVMDLGSSFKLKK